METVERRLESWTKALLDLSFRNRLLNIPLTSPSAPRQRTLRFQLPTSSAIYSMLLDESKINVLSPPDPRPTNSEIDADHDENGESHKTESKRDLIPDANALPPNSILTVQPTTVANKLALRLMRQGKTTLSEQGINTLFATFGVLKWRDPKGRQDRRAPLLLAPVELIEDTQNQIFRIQRFDEGVELNLTLAERLLGDFGLTVAPPVPGEGEEYNYELVTDHVRGQIQGRDGWEVLDEAHVGLFQFHKLRMVRDLREHANVAGGHPIIQALATDGMQVEAPFDPQLPKELDQRVAAEDTYSILDADSSQTSVIETVKSGTHVIVQGPPGTGKSQTIANMIAETIAQGKTVLFVSEKAAALDVVYRRLAQAGLGDYCLPLHSHKANKTEIINSLHGRMEQFDVGRGTQSISLRELNLHDALRQRLNAYPEALHGTREPFGHSIYSALSTIASLNDLPDTPALPIPSVTELTDEQLETWCDAITKMSRHYSVLAQGNDHTWAILGDHQLSLAEQYDLRSVLTSLALALDELAETTADVTRVLGLPPPSCTADTLRLTTIVDLLPGQLAIDPEGLHPEIASDTLRLAQEAQKRHTKIRGIADDLLTQFNESIFGLPHASLVTTYQQGFLSRTFSPAHRQNRKTLQAELAHGTKLSESQEHEALQKLVALSPEIRWLEDNANILSSRLGISIERPWATPPDVFDRPLTQLEKLCQLMAEYPDRQIPASLTDILSQQRVSSIRDKTAQITLYVDTLSQASQELIRFLPEANCVIENQEWCTIPFNDLQQWVSTRVNAFDELDAWLQARSALSDIRHLGLEHSLTHLRSRNVEPDKWGDVMKRRILSRWIAEQISSDSVIGSFNRQDHEEVISQFRDLDIRMIASGTRRIHERHSALRRNIGYGTAGEPEVLRRQFAKKRNKYPPRLLFQQIPRLLQELKPCLMMSPLSVAHFLPADLFSFDLVIFDEASQVRPHDAIGAIMRGKQLVVAGDRHQLPPTAFFDTDLNPEEDEDDSLTDMESILDALSTKGIRSLPLTWHYRSRHEDLIAFSNHFIYNDVLHTFPTSVNGRSPEAGVHFRYVENGLLTRKKDGHNREQKRNEEEIKVVLDEIRAHFNSQPNRSLGVVALNKWHTEAIWDAIHEHRLIDRQLDEWLSQERDEPFFVKNLEEVQGDERDVMIVSIGFAKEASEDSEKLNHNFGPINQDVGKRRINVLVTRAKHKLVLVSSIRDEDIDETRIRRTGGMWLLKQYLAYAEKGPQSLELRTGEARGEAESEFEREVARTVNKLGFDTHLQVGVSRYRIDIGVVDPRAPNRYLLGIECDGATYHSSKTARDRDRLRQAILEGHGWRIHRIWSTEWFRNRESEVRRLADALEHGPVSKEVSDYGDRVRSDTASSAEPDREVIARSTSPQPTPPIVHGKASETPGEAHLRALPSFKAATYEVARLDKGPHLSEIFQASPSTIERMILQCVEVEGPIHIDLLVKRIASAWGYGRAGARIRDRIERDLNRLVLARQSIERSGDFLALVHRPVVAVRGADKDGNVRRIDWVSAEELRLAFQIVLQRALSLSKPEMVTESARYLGYDRTGTAIKARLDREIIKAMSAGEMELVNDRYQLAGPQAKSQQFRKSTL